MNGESYKVAINFIVEILLSSNNNINIKDDDDGDDDKDTTEKKKNMKFWNWRVKYNWRMKTYQSNWNEVKSDEQW